MSTDLFVICNCSRRVGITPADCGGAICCSCGNVVNVPLLSQVRQECGYDAIDVGIVNKLNHLNSENKLPLEQNCVACKTITTNSVQCLINCERIVVKRRGGGFWTVFLLALFTPWTWTRFFFYEEEPAEIHGRDTFAIVPVRVCENCSKQFRKSKRNRKELLKKTDLYRELLQTYPDAITSVVEKKDEPLPQADLAPDSKNPYSYR